MGTKGTRGAFFVSCEKLTLSCLIGVLLFTPVHTLASGFPRKPFLELVRGAELIAVVEEIDWAGVSDYAAGCWWLGHEQTIVTARVSRVLKGPAGLEYVQYRTGSRSFGDTLLSLYRRPVSSERPGEIEIVFIKPLETGCIAWSGYEPGDLSIESAIVQILDPRAHRNDEVTLAELIISGGVVSEFAIEDLSRKSGSAGFSPGVGVFRAKADLPLPPDLRARLRRAFREGNEREWSTTDLGFLLSLVWGDSDREFDRTFLAKLRSALTEKWFKCLDEQTCRASPFAMRAICMFMDRRGFKVEGEALCDGRRYSAELLTSEWSELSSKLQKSVDKKARPVRH